ncbi:hypothetical protein [Flavobacterium sp. B183]|uniref:hypothetical protein n=1 Tax=Flavobacterium sp. B183 TaxID=907046 RepID=UPI00201EF25C|nr:hypothetical protein [Flavobacterium sp. B183]URC13111.1 hypothetical protein M4I44_01575 [Flavobacterium sp. B183]
MKIIIVTLIKGSFPFVEELKDELIKKGNVVEIFDMFDMYTLKIENNSTQIKYHLQSSFLRKLCGIRFFGAIIRLFFYKIYLIFKPLKCDHITIHYVLPFYSFFIDAFKKKSSSVSACVWGSDFYRISEKKRNKMKKIFYKCDSIVIGNLEMGKEFSNFYGENISKKVRNVAFGIKKIDIIKDFKEKYSTKFIKSSINFPLNKLIVTIGYNGLFAQQHLLILRSLEKLSDEIKNNLFLVVPFGYGGDLKYKNILIDKLDSLNIEYIIFDHFITDDEVAKIRIGTDLVINAQISDAASASIQEHLYSENVVLAGEWLPYGYFLNKGIHLWTFKESELTEEIEKIIGNFSKYLEEVRFNSERVHNLSSWMLKIDEWINVFENKL